MDRKAKLSELIGILTRDVTGCFANEDCEDACLETIAMLSSREKIEVICLHESGHFAESSKLGVMVGFEERDIRYHAPRVIYRPENLKPNKFEPNPGSINTPFEAQEITWTMPILKQSARVAVAGGVYAHVLAKRPVDEGTEGDRELFETYYRIALKKLHAHPELLDASELWDWATNEVQCDLQQYAELRIIARRKASQFIHEYYCPFLEFCDPVH